MKEDRFKALPPLIITRHLRQVRDRLLSNLLEIPLKAWRDYKIGGLLQGSDSSHNDVQCLDS